MQSEVQRALRSAVQGSICGRISFASRNGSRLRGRRGGGARRLRHQFTFNSAECAVCGRRSDGSRIVARAPASRGKQLVQQVDAYDLLLHGVRSDLKRLENGDTLLVPPLGPQVTVEGMVRRPRVYELLDETSSRRRARAGGRNSSHCGASSHRSAAGGSARKAHHADTGSRGSTPTLKRSTSNCKRSRSRTAIRCISFPIASYNEDAIYLQGHVLRPGRYSYKPGMKLTDLISSYADLLPEPAPHYAEIIRLNPPDFHPSVESFDISAALVESGLCAGLESSGHGANLQPLRF